MSSISYLRFLGLNVLLFLSDATYAAICSTSKGGSWSDIGNPHDIMRALSGLCNDYGVTNKNYSLYDGETECIHVNNHSFSYQFSFNDPVTLPPGKQITFSRLDCMYLGRAIIAKCSYGGQLSMIPGNATAHMMVQAEPWLGSSCTGNSSNSNMSRRETRSSEPVPGSEYDGCYNGTNAVQNITWDMIDDTIESILASLETACAHDRLGNKTYAAGSPGVARCIKTTYGSFVFKIQGIAPWWNGTTVPNSDVYLSVGGCIALGMEAISKCDYGGYFTSLVVGPTADGTSQISANVGVEPALNDLCRHG